MILLEGRDVEEAHHVVSTHFAPHRLRVLEDSGLNGRFVTTHTGPVSAFTLGYGATVEVRAGELPDICNVHGPLTGCGSLQVDATRVRTSCSVVGPGQRLTMRWSADSDTLILRRVRLERAHLDLVEIAEGRPEGTVSEVAIRWGFMHLGRFSAQYRKVYGRLPVQTLCAGRQAAAGVS